MINDRMDKKIKTAGPNIHSRPFSHILQTSKQDQVLIYSVKARVLTCIVTGIVKSITVILKRGTVGPPHTHTHPHTHKHTFERAVLYIL